MSESRESKEVHGGGGLSWQPVVEKVGFTQHGDVVRKSKEGDGGGGLAGNLLIKLGSHGVAARADVAGSGMAVWVWHHAGDSARASGDCGAAAWPHR
jgi:hypothetical protein